MFLNCCFQLVLPVIFRLTDRSCFCVIHRSVYLTITLMCWVRYSRRYTCAMGNSPFTNIKFLKGFSAMQDLSRSTYVYQVKDTFTFNNFQNHVLVFQESLQQSVFVSPVDHELVFLESILNHFWREQQTTLCLVIGPVSTYHRNLDCTAKSYHRWKRWNGGW